MHSTRRSTSTAHHAAVVALFACTAICGPMIMAAAALRVVDASPVNGVSSSIQAPVGATIDETRLKSRTTPIQCAGVEKVELDGVLLRGDKVAIQAMAECRMVIKNSHVVGSPAVMAAGKAEITFENCIIEGSLNLAGSSVTSFRSSTIRGRVRKLQSAETKDLGQNVWP
jgi:hypothetical protein